MFIDPVPQNQVEGLTAELYEAEVERFGFLSEYVQVFSHHPEAFQDWEALVATLFRGMDRRRCELVTLAASLRMKSTCCAVAHGRALRDRFFTTDEVIQIASDHHRAGLDEVDVAAMDFAEKVADDPASTSQADIDHLRSLGLTDREIFDVVFAVAARAFLVTVIESLGNTAERPWVDDLEPELLEALTVGRPAT